jgi:hypothetical protein
MRCIAMLVKQSFFQPILQRGKPMKQERQSDSSHSRHRAIELLLPLALLIPIYWYLLAIGT